MKRIERHRAILGVDDKATLSDLKKVYRKIMMEWHPDKFQDSDEAKKMAEEKSAKLIASYHFLVSVHIETHEATKDAYIATTTDASIDDFEFVGSNNPFPDIGIFNDACAGHHYFYCLLGFGDSQQLNETHQGHCGIDSTAPTYAYRNL